MTGCPEDCKCGNNYCDAGEETSCPEDCKVIAGIGNWWIWAVIGVLAAAIIITAVLIIIRIKKKKASAPAPASYSGVKVTGAGPVVRQ